MPDDLITSNLKKKVENLIFLWGRCIFPMSNLSMWSWVTLHKLIIYSENVISFAVNFKEKQNGHFNLSVQTDIKYILPPYIRTSSFKISLIFLGGGGEILPFCQMVLILPWIKSKRHTLTHKHNLTFFETDFFFFLIINCYIFVVDMKICRFYITLNFVILHSVQIHNVNYQN